MCRKGCIPNCALANYAATKVYQKRVFSTKNIKSLFFMDLVAPFITRKTLKKHSYELLKIYDVLWDELTLFQDVDMNILVQKIQLLTIFFLRFFSIFQFWMNFRKYLNHDELWIYQHCKSLNSLWPSTQRFGLPNLLISVNVYFFFFQNSKLINVHTHDKEP